VKALSWDDATSSRPFWRRPIHPPRHYLSSLEEADELFEAYAKMDLRGVFVAYLFEFFR
jgi:hypothetical protein